MTQVLIIGYVWPEPNSSAAGSHMMQLINLFLAQKWHVTFASPASDSDHMLDIEALGIKKQAIELNNVSFDTFIKNLQPNIVLFDRFMMEEQFAWRVEKHCPTALRMIETCDFHCLREGRHKALKAQRKFIKNDLNSEIAIREVSAILRCDLSLMISSVETQLLIDHFKVSSDIVITVPFMLEKISAPSFNSYEQRQHYLSIGNFRHAPNWDAVVYLKNTIWPLIRKKQPKAQLDIYGAYPPPKATQLHNPKQGFNVKGWVEDAQEAMRNARICLAPLRFGAGQKGKLIDAMTCGTPSVTTTIGAESMHGNLPWNGAITDTPEDFANAAVKLYNDENQWQVAQRQGIEIINQKFDYCEIGDLLLKRIEEIRSNLSEHRLNNFTGAMLRHHSMKSTQYMAQWIEAKNKNQ